MARPRKDDDKPVSKRPPATTPQARENQLISMAYDAAEKQIKSGNASSQVITHFLKLGTAKEGLEREKLIAENKLLLARVDGIANSAQSIELYEKAISAFRTYQGAEDEIDYND